MAERAHPDLPGFRHRFVLHWKYGVLPCISYVRSPYRLALMRRYGWVNRFCAGSDVLDVPCGMGWGTSLLRGCKSVIGMDVDEGSIHEARRRYGKGASFVAGDMASLPFADSSFDLVACLEGIEHVPCDVGRGFLRHVHRVLRAEGQLILTSPTSKTGSHSGNPFHVHEYGKEEMEQLLSRHFDIVEATSHDVDQLVVHSFRARKANGRSDAKG